MQGETGRHPVPGTPSRIVFVCTGNICRSPMAEVAARTMAGATALVDGSILGDRLILTSAGTGGWHEGEPMDPRTAAALRRADYPDHPHIAHQIRAPALFEYDLVVALDRGHQQTLGRLGAEPSRLVLLRSFDPSAGAAAGPATDVAAGPAGVGADVPDPYYGDESGFDECLAMITRACRGLVATVATQWDAALSA